MVERTQLLTRNSNAAVRLNGYYPLILTGILAVSYVVYPSRVWLVLLCAVGGLTALGYYWAVQMARHVSIRRDLRFGWVQVGDRLEEQFTLVNHSWLPVLWAEVGDESSLPGYRVDRIASSGGPDTIRWVTEAECTRRGVFTLGPWSLHIEDPFGFFSVRVLHDEAEVIVVYPPVVHLPEIALPRGLVTGPARARRRAIESTTDASQTRFYQPSDPLRLIHWPSTAHRGDLIVRELDTLVSGDLWIVLDLDRAVQVGQEEESTEEYGVILAASLADKTLHQNLAVGLVAHGAELAFVPLGRGKGQMWHILQALATLQAGGTKRLVEVLHSVRQNLGQGTTVLVITPSCDPEWLGALLPLIRRGIAPTVVLLDPESFSSPASERTGVAQAMRERLAEAGIATHVIHQGYSFRYVVSPKRRGHWDFKVTPLGRAVLVRHPGEEAR
jgi:uncharacterized protein (DUF58 family)